MPDMGCEFESCLRIGAFTFFILTFGGSLPTVSRRQARSLRCRTGGGGGRRDMSDILTLIWRFLSSTTSCENFLIGLLCVSRNDKPKEITLKT